MTGSADLLHAALEYAERGWLVVPLNTPAESGCSCGRPECNSPGKHPRTPHGLKDASRDPATIREWWMRWPEANIGILTGPESSILVLDVDGKQGEESLIQFERRGYHLPDTYTVRTGGGQHLYVHWPDDHDVRNSVGKIAPGLDIRGQGGYVVAPPSLHASGRCYEINESAIPAVPCPAWLLSLIQELPSAQARNSVPAANAPIEHPDRTPHLVSLAGTMNKRGMDPAAIEAALLAENEAKCSPPLSESKVRSIARAIPARYPSPMPEKRSSLKPDLVCLADVEARPVDWLWEPFIPLRMLSMISGDPGAGKSFVALALASGLSRGKLPNGRVVDPASTLYLTLENPTAEVMRPRFNSLGGDPQRLHLLQGTRFAVDGVEHRGPVSLADIGTLEAAIVQTCARLVVVDPLQSYFGSQVDLHRSNETRPILDGLAKLADAHGCAILLLRHLSKQSGGKAIHRGLGSIDLTGAARSEMLAGCLPDDPNTRAFVHIKSNLGPIGNALSYSIDGEGRFMWIGESTITAADLLAAPAIPGDRKLAEASQWLVEQLRSGSRGQKEVRELANNAGISYATVRRAYSTLGVRARKVGMSGPWTWSLPEGAHDPAEGAQKKGVDTFAELNAFDGECGGLLQ
jgi:hypothetical protein